MPVFLISFIIFVVWLRYEINKSKKSSDKHHGDFWEREQQSNFSRKADISSLDYIIVPMDELPFVHTQEDDLSRIQEQVKLSSQKKLLNLSSSTNTDLKLKYGTANLSLLSEYDQNYSNFIQNLYKWAKLLYEKGYLAEAEKVLELGITYHSDISGNYTLLANLYKDKNDFDSIGKLIKKAEELNTLMKDSIIKSLTKIMNSY
jgi:tetratricopeptide (TPR) repeat protein